MESGLLSDPKKALCAVGLLALIAAGCDESLPPRLPDPNPISVYVRISSGHVLVAGGLVGGNGGRIEAGVTNIYTEVLQDTVAVAIRCRIWLASYPDSAGVALVDASCLTTPNMINNGLLTILPHATALFEKTWNYTTPAGTPFWSLVPLKDTTDTQGYFRISPPVKVYMTDTARIFKPVPDYILGPDSATIRFEVR